MRRFIAIALIILMAVGIVLHNRPKVYDKPEDFTRGGDENSDNRYKWGIKMEIVDYDRAGITLKVSQKDVEGVKLGPYEDVSPWIKIDGEYDLLYLKDGKWREQPWGGGIVAGEEIIIGFNKGHSKVIMVDWSYEHGYLTDGLYRIVFVVEDRYHYWAEFEID